MTVSVRVVRWPVEREVEVPDDALVVVVDDTAPATDPDDLVARWSAAGIDAMCRVAAVVDALVVIDEGGRIASHLERAEHGRIGFPQVLGPGWWRRIQSLADTTDVGPAATPAEVVIGLGGRVAALPDAP